MFISIYSNTNTEREPLPDEVLVSYPARIPEGIEYDVLRERFLLSSGTQGTIWQDGLFNLMLNP